VPIGALTDLMTYLMTALTDCAKYLTYLANIFI
jgi:hypothetical protein